ncbi:hypothetical protein ACHQM5_023209 [Ranunculus cassubicifolius]
MTSNLFSEEDAQMFFASQLHPSLYNHAVPVGEGELKKRRRRKMVREGGEDMRKRKLSVEQVNSLEYNFTIDHNLETQRKEKIAAELGLDPQQVAIWFQNRRVRWRIKKQEEEYFKLKTAHERVVLEKSHLEQEVLRLKAQLSDTEIEKKKLVERSKGGVSSSSQSSSFSMDFDSEFFGEFGMDEFGNGFQFYEDYGSTIYGMEWINSA